MFPIIQKKRLMLSDGLAYLKDGSYLMLVWRLLRWATLERCRVSLLGAGFWWRRSDTD